MDLGTLGAKELEARQRILEASQKLASKMNLDPSLLEQLNRTNRDQRLKALFQLEAVAQIMEAVSTSLENEPAKPTRKGK